MAPNERGDRGQVAGSRVVAGIVAAAHAQRAVGQALPGGNLDESGLALVQAAGVQRHLLVGCQRLGAPGAVGVAQLARVEFAGGDPA
jgi:hypothetical protein